MGLQRDFKLACRTLQTMCPGFAKYMSAYTGATCRLRSADPPAHCAENKNAYH